jgi:hypothetical protein
MTKFPQTRSECRGYFVSRRIVVSRDGTISWKSYLKLSRKRPRGAKQRKPSVAAGDATKPVTRRSDAWHKEAAMLPFDDAVTYFARELRVRGG